MAGLNQGFIEKVIKDMEKLGKPRVLYADYSYIKLVFLWTLFEAWIDTQGQFKNAKDGIDHVRENKNNFTKIYPDIGRNAGQGIISSANALGIKILPPRKSKENPNNSSLFYDANDTAEDVIALIYEIRNKIVHGEWQFDWSNDHASEKSAVYVASDLFEKWIRWANLQGVLR